MTHARDNAGAKGLAVHSNALTSSPVASIQDTLRNSLPYSVPQFDEVDCTAQTLQALACHRYAALGHCITLQGSDTTGLGSPAAKHTSSATRVAVGLAAGADIQCTPIAVLTPTEPFSGTQGLEQALHDVGLVQ